MIHARPNTEVFHAVFLLSKAKFSPRVPSSKFTLSQAIEDVILRHEIKTTNLILGVSSSFSQKFPPTKITRYMVFM